MIRTSVGEVEFSIVPFATCADVYTWLVQFQIVPDAQGYAERFAPQRAAFLAPFVVGHDAKSLAKLDAATLSALGDRIVWASSLPPDLLKAVGAFWDLACKADRYDLDNPRDPTCECLACKGKAATDSSCRFSAIPETGKLLSGVAAVLDFPEFWDKPYWLLQLKRRLETSRNLGLAAPYQERDRKDREEKEAKEIRERLGITSWAALGRA